MDNQNNADEALNLWLWNANWNNPYPHEVGLLRTLLAKGDKERFNSDELALIKTFTDDSVLDSMTFNQFINQFDLPYLAELAKKCILSAETVRNASRSIKINLSMDSSPSVLEFITSENGEFEECNWLERTWQGDKRSPVPGDVARAYWQNLKQCETLKQKMEQKQKQNVIQEIILEEDDGETPAMRL